MGPTSDGITGGPSGSDAAAHPLCVPIRAGLGPLAGAGLTVCLVPLLSMRRCARMLQLRDNL